MIKFIFLMLFSIVSFSETVTSPNMSLPVPVVGTTPGPTWANNINSCLGAIDSHNHTPGYGVAIPPSGLNINSSLPMNDNALTSTMDVVFTSQSSLSTLDAIYVSGGDLFYNDGSGNVVRITQSGSVAGASGTITGLPSGTASASYQSIPGTFQFQSATNTPANISGASIKISEQSATPNGITIQSPNSLAAAYSLTLPTGLPAALSFLMESASGVLSNRTLTAPTVQTFTAGQTGTYTTPTGVLWINLIMTGGGAGGAASATNGGVDGATSSFGSNSCSGSVHGGPQGVGGAGGTCSLAAGFNGIAVTGGGGGPGTSSTGNGGTGGNSALGGGGYGGSSSNGGGGAAGTGGGGGGGAGGTSGAGGGAGGYINAIKTSPAATYTYAVADTVAGGSSGGNSGGIGGSGSITVIEYYQ